MGIRSVPASDFANRQWLYPTRSLARSFFHVTGHRASFKAALLKNRFWFDDKPIGLEPTCCAPFSPDRFDRHRPFF